MESALRFLKGPASESCFLFGARCTGKSNWFHYEYGKSARIDLISLVFFGSTINRNSSSGTLLTFDNLHFLYIFYQHPAFYIHEGVFL